MIIKGVEREMEEESINVLEGMDIFHVKEICIFVKDNMTLAGP